jgi:four helix bundle protein
MRANSDLTRESPMKYERFEQLPVWQASIELARRVYQLTRRPPLRRERSLSDQVQRAAVSVSNNIAEGFERGTTQELLTFLYIARGSAGEVRSMLCLFESLFDSLFESVPDSVKAAESANFKFEISDLKSQAEGISRQLRGWAESLQESPIPGQRYLTNKTRRAEKTRKDRDEFLKKLERIRQGGK